MSDDGAHSQFFCNQRYVWMSSSVGTQSKATARYVSTFGAFLNLKIECCLRFKMGVTISSSPTQN